MAKIKAFSFYSSRFNFSKYIQMDSRQVIFPLQISEWIMIWSLCKSRFESCVLAPKSTFFTSRVIAKLSHLFNSFPFFSQSTFSFHSTAQVKINKKNYAPRMARSNSEMDPAIEWVLEAGCESGFVSCDNNWCCDVNDFIVPKRREFEQAEKPKIDSESSIDTFAKRFCFLFFGWWMFWEGRG